MAAEAASERWKSVRDYVLDPLCGYTAGSLRIASEGGRIHGAR